MSLKVKAKERKFKVGKYAGEYRYVMVPELYSALSQEKVIREAALRSGVSEGVMHACWDAAGEVIKAWATEGHSVALPGLGSMRFGLSAKSVADVNDVKSSLITTRRIVFTPAVELKQELKETSVVITCYDRNGNEVKRVTSDDDGTVEEPDNTTQTGENDGGNSGGQNQNENGGGTQNGGTGGDTGGNSGGDNGGGGNGGNDNHED
jgi:predicted histone-like DNA-binding protein